MTNEELLHEARHLLGEVDYGARIQMSAEWCERVDLFLDLSFARDCKPAEPGADERAACDAAYERWTTSPDFRQYNKPGFDAGYRAAQSGQRAGVAEDAKVLPPEVLDVLRFYANGGHFILADDTAWDTVSGEPQNFWCDEAGTATVEDGSLAKAVLQGKTFTWEDPEPPVVGEVFIAQGIDDAPTQQQEGDQ